MSTPIPRRKVWAWAMWDWGTQPLNTVIITFVFSVYITSSAFGDTNATSFALSMSTLVAGLAVALVAPVLGQNSDRTGRTVRNLRWQTWVIAALAAALYFVRPDPAFLWLGLGILAVASLARSPTSTTTRSSTRCRPPRTSGACPGSAGGSGIWAASSRSSF